MPTSENRILIIDSYDSFTNNLAALISRAIPKSRIYIIKNDEWTFETLKQSLPYFSAIFVGPGPGSPSNPSDIGIVNDLWRIPDQLLLPIFGVCLGLQSLGLEYGASIEKLTVVKHGYVSPIYHDESDLYSEIPNGCSVVRYHSLHVRLPEDAQKLVALAWTDDVSDNGHVVMALQHTSKPFYAVQYHPESVCTDDNGLKLICNFWTIAKQWSETYGRQIRSWDANVDYLLSPNQWPSLRRTATPRLDFVSQKVTTSCLSLPQLTIPQICEILGVYKSTTDFVLLDSAAHPGKYTIIGCIQPNTLKITYHVGDDFVTLCQGKKQHTCSLGSSSIWSWISDFMRTKEARGGDVESPFWGGLIGYLSYELGVETSRIGYTLHESKDRSERHPDVNLVYVERSLVIDTKTGKIRLQSLNPGDDDWFASTASGLKRAAARFEAKNAQPGDDDQVATLGKVDVMLPDKQTYISRIKIAQDYPFSGDSYELCLTAQTRIRLPKLNASSTQSSWDLYKKVRSVNPAPYSAYLRLGPSTLVSSSPERFLSYSRPPGQRLQLRPIKGTVRKGNDMTKEMAEEILSSQKEVGENLMIVDLIRHDLHGVVGKDVQVKKFCGIEEYKTVWQLVSVIEGGLSPDESDEQDSQIGWETLGNCLPPGSMTGAPKKRSVQILHGLEDDDRTIYSGVVGYWSVCGAGDWSVVIRSLYRHDSSGEMDSSVDSAEKTQDPIVEPGYEEWLVGAGGAITALSDPEAEWDEMVVKLQSVLRAFDVKI